ncbi:hypothetical protein G6M50_07825 [Agrobacterium rhizogenes]|nr:hypothetical protein [Rhizobium rhizogenes]NTJ77707.1 hypothetical protein [Rhizobium rhizogenes]
MSQWSPQYREDGVLWSAIDDAMGVVVRFKRDGIGGQRLMRTAKLEEELKLTFPSAPMSGHEERNPPLAKYHERSADPEVGFSLAGIAIKILAIAVYGLIAFHVASQPRYSSRANLLLPPMVQQ